MADKLKRLYSLDVLRGFDMLILLYGSTLAWSMKDVGWWPRWILTQFSHPWGVYTLFDIVQPLFAVVCGAAVPLALGRRMTDGYAGAVYWKHVASRFGLLYLMGALCGGLLTLDMHRFPFFGNTLHLLGFGYVFTAVCYAYLPRKAWLWVSLALVGGWGLALHFGGDLTPAGSFAAKVERSIAGFFVPGKTLDKVVWPSWGLIPSFCALTVLGAHAIGFLMDECRSAVFRANALLAAGAVLFAAGWGLHLVQPEIKHLYTPSYTVISAGISLFLLGAFYWIYDIWGLRRGTWVALLYGRFALASYVIWGVFNGPLQAAGAIVMAGVNAKFVPAAYTPLVNMCGTLFLLTYVLWLWSLARNK